MKILFVILSLLNNFYSVTYLSDRLCSDSEEIIFSFILTKSKKVVTICKDKNDKYLIYRFGTKDKIELTYPKLIDENSWKNFKYYSVHRGGGKDNAAFGEISLSFDKDNAEYKIYHNWRDENNSNEIGIEVKINGQTIKMKGDINSQIGALQDLDFSDLIVNQAEE